MSNVLLEDLDDTLLALAAGGASGENSPTNSPPPHAQSPSPSAGRRGLYSLNSRVSSSQSPKPRGPKLSSPNTSMGNPRTFHLARESVPEEPAPPDSPRSLGSGAMDESDSDDSDSPRNASGLTGLEREQRLAEIAEQELERHKLAQLEGLTAKWSKRKAPSVDREDEADEDRHAVRRRVKRDTLPASAAAPATRRKPPGSTIPRSPEADRVTASKAIANIPKTPSPVDQHGELTDYQRLQIGRTNSASRCNFADICFFPDFEKFLVGCFTRVCFNQDNVTRENQYRMTRIQKFVTGKPYPIENKRGHTHMCDVYFVAQYGANERTYPLVACSDSRLTEPEFVRWKSTTDSDNIPQLTKAQIAEQTKQMYLIFNREWQHHEVTIKLANQCKHDHLLKTNKAVLQQQQQALYSSETLRRDEALQRLNKRNRQQNQIDIRNAELEEKRMRREFSKQEAKRLKAATNGEKQVDTNSVQKINPYRKQDLNDFGKFARMKTLDEIIAEIDIVITVNV